MVKNIKPEFQALRYAHKTQHKTFTHIFSGLGDLHFKSDDFAHPELVVHFNKATELIYNAIKRKPVEFYYKSYAGKYGAGVVPKELIKYAYESCVMDDRGLLHIQIDFSEDSLLRKYLGKPEVRVIDDFIFWIADKYKILFLLKYGVSVAFDSSIVEWILETIAFLVQ